MLASAQDTLVPRVSSGRGALPRHLDDWHPVCGSSWLQFLLSNPSGEKWSVLACYVSTAIQKHTNSPRYGYACSDSGVALD